MKASTGMPAISFDPSRRALAGMVDPLVLGRTAAARLREVLASEKG